VKLNANLLEQDLYGVLGVPRRASRDEIRRRYLHLVRVSHPDRHPFDENAAARRMAAINVAAAVLLDPPLRAEYDRRRAESAASARSSAQRARPARPWVAYAADPGIISSVWATRQARRRLGRDQRRVLESLRPWTSRQFEAVSLWHAEQPARSQLVFFVATVMLAFFLIGAARPRPLWDPPKRVTTTAAEAPRPGASS
jgi:curved DNA-binding protein CbpA